MKDHHHLQQALGQQDKETLIAVIERLLAMDPSQEDLVYTLILPPMVEPFDPSPMRARADQVFASYEPSWRNSRYIVAELHQLEEVGAVLEGGGRRQAAASAYAGLLVSIAYHIEWQDECEYDWFLERCVEVLERCIEAETDEALRAQMIDTFGEVLAFEVLSGGYSLDDHAGPPFLRRASLDQRRRLVRRLRERLREIQLEGKSGVEYRRGRVREWITKLLPEEDPSAWMPSLQEALPHYKAQVEAFIAKKSSAGYHEACRWLEHVAGGYRESRDNDGFVAYVTSLREQHPTLRSLHRALDRAGF